MTRNERWKREKYLPRSLSPIQQLALISERLRSDSADLKRINYERICWQRRIDSATSATDATTRDERSGASPVSMMGESLSTSHG